jgi:hypothetical protein
MQTIRLAWFALTLSLAAGCGSQAAPGTLHMSASGEAAAVDGYPSSTGVGYVDGWTMQWDFILISVGGFYIHGSTSDPTGPALSEEDQVVINLHDAVSQDVWTFPGVPSQRYADVGYQILPPTMSSRRVGTVSDANLAAMVSGGISYWLHGTAHHPDHHDVVLDLRIPMHTSMSDCMNAIDMTEGLVVTPNGTADLQLTFHLDHVFFDSIVVPEPDLRFEAYAAAAGSDFVVTFDELASQPLANLHDIDGTPLVDAMGTQIVYDPGSTPLARQDLRSFVYHQATTVGHFNGEGHCTYVCIDASGNRQPTCPAP